MADVSVIGAGVSGLSTGIRLLEAGYKVKIFHNTPLQIQFQILLLLGGIPFW